MQIRQYFKSLLLLFLLLSSGCNSKNIRDISEIARAGDPVKQAGKILEQKGRDIAADPGSLPQELLILKAKIDKFKRLIDSIWGKEDVPEAGPKDYVKYTDKYYNRAHIDFEAGTVTIETLAPDDQTDYLKKAIITTLLTPDDPREVDLYSDTAPGGDKTGKPFLYEQVLDHDGKAIAWQWRANRYAEYLIKNKLRKVSLGKRRGLQVQFPLIASHQQERAYKYASLIQNYS